LASLAPTRAPKTPAVDASVAAPTDGAAWATIGGRFFDLDGRDGREADGRAAGLPASGNFLTTVG
jgi:hypothetical protein